MKNLLKLSAAVFFSFVSLNASASTWNVVSINDDALYFFDADTVEKTRDKNVLVWVKLVRTTKADADGSWADALRWKFNCPKRTIQTLAWSSYDRDGTFIRSSQATGKESEVIPDSVGETILKVACDPSFPNDKSEKYYFKVKNNDIFQATRNYIESQNSKIDSAPK